MTAVALGDMPISMSSMEIADLTGKEHKNVIRDIRDMVAALEKDGSDLSHLVEDKDARGYTTAFHLDKELTETLLTGYSVPLRRVVIRRLHEMEEKVLRGNLPDFSNPSAAARAWADQYEKAIALTAERDHAVATKALIGSKREATAMNTAAQKSREAAKLRDQLGFSARHATVLQVESAMGRDFPWHPLRKYCREQGLTVEAVPDKRFPNGVKAWPAKAWAAVYDVCLEELFGEEVAA